MFQTLTNWLKHPILKSTKLLYTLFGLLALFVSIRYVFLVPANNYSIFYYSLQHLQSGESLYPEYPDLYSDHYHYSPTFAALFSPFFLLPYKVGLFLWPFFFTAIWVWAVKQLPYSHRHKIFIYWFAIQELLTSIDNVQTNPLIAVIPILAFICFEKKQPFWAAALIMLGFNIKIYSLVTAGLFILYPQKIKFLLSMLFWAVALACLPLIYTTPEKLWWQYEQWVNQLFIKANHDKIYNHSIHRLINSFIAPNMGSTTIIGIGAFLFCTVYIYVKKYADYTFKSLLLASILIFHVIFNPVAESPSYIIAITGVCIYWIFSPKNKLDIALMIICYILTILSPTDLFPAYLRNNFVIPYVLKAVPCVIIWFRILVLMHKRKYISV